MVPVSFISGLAIMHHRLVNTQQGLFHGFNHHTLILVEEQKNEEA